jgi:hypothetical protein
MSSFPGIFNVAVTAADALGGEEYRPSAWDQPAQTMITIPATSQPGTASPGVDLSGIALLGAPPFVGKPPIVLVFDAVLRLEHSQTLQITSHPVQSGTAISDHAYRIQPRVTLEIGMSDAIESFNPNAWTSATSKSVSAYQTILDLQKNRTLVTLTTRLDTYENCVIESINAPDTYKTKHGLRMTVTFKQIFMATVESVSSRVLTTPVVSARAQTTAATAIGELQTVPVSQAITSQHNILADVNGVIPATLIAAKVPGAGLWSSTNINSLKSLLQK